MSEQTPPTSINLRQIAQTLLRIVADLPESEYTEVNSTDLSERQAAEQTLTDPSDPASDTNTAQGCDVL
jgi:hypothetical protein